MSVWVCLPSARPVDQVNARMAKWRERGYKIVIARDSGDHAADLGADLVISPPAGVAYRGYARTANGLLAWVFGHDDEHKLKGDKACDWAVCAADDIDPDPGHTADEIASECSFHLAALAGLYAGVGNDPGPGLDTFGVMQPTGDRWGDKNGAYIDRVAGSPWIGREFARRMYRGKGPYWPEYTHMGVDEELQFVAMKHGVFWQRADLIHYHDHWGKPRAGERIGQRNRMPAFLEHANSPEEWDRYKGIFNARRAAGFPGSDPLP